MSSWRRTNNQLINQTKSENRASQLIDTGSWVSQNPNYEFQLQASNSQLYGTTKRKCFCNFTIAVGCWAQNPEKGNKPILHPVPTFTFHSCFFLQLPLYTFTFYSCHFPLLLSTDAFTKKNNNVGRMISISPLISVSSVFSIFALIYERKWCDTLIFSFISTFFPLGIATSLKLDYEHFHCIMIFHKLLMIYGDG